jgi:hypothetical protein
MRTAPIVARCLLAAAIAGSPALALASCASTPVIDVELEDPLDLREGATFAQLVIYEGGCPEKADLAEGKITGQKWSQSISVDGNFNEIGSLEKTSYGFAALLRNDDCGVVGFGCTPVDLEHHRHVTIAVNELVSPPRGECASDETCNNSVCVKGSTGEGGVDADAKPDTGPLTCDLNLIAAESFDLPTQAGTLYTGPAVVATPTGFVIMYREADASGSSPRAVRVKISDEGEEDGRANVNLTPCADNIESNGLGAAWNDVLGAGLMAVSMPACPSSATDGGVPAPRMHVSNFDREGNTITATEYNLPSTILLNPVKSVAASPGAPEFLVAAMAGAAPFLYVFDGVGVQQDPPPAEIHKGNGTATFAQVATATNSRATLTDSDLEGGKLVVTVNDVGSGTSSSNSFPRTTVTSLTVWSDRAAVIQPDGSSLAWHAFAKSGSAIEDGTLAGGPYTSMDLAQLHDYVLIAGAQTESITIFRLDDANGTFTSSSTLQTELSSSFGNTTLDSFQGDRVAIAAARGRVVVAWVTSTAPLSSTTTAPGGYAVLGCDG